MEIAYQMIVNKIKLNKNQRHKSEEEERRREGKPKERGKRSWEGQSSQNYTASYYSDRKAFLKKNTKIKGNLALTD
jgi:hypothetical protein